MEYTSLLGRSVIDICTLKFIISSNLELHIQDIIIEGLHHLTLLHVAAITKRHFSYLRKCMLTLIVSDFNQLTSKPIQFEEFMSFRNQIGRYSYFFAFSIFVLFPEYLRIVSAALFNHDAKRLYFHLSSHKLTYDIVSSLIFHILSLAICLKSLTETRKTDIEMRANGDVVKSNIRPLIFAMTTFMLVIISSFIIELLTFQYRIKYSVGSNMNMSNMGKIIHWIFFAFEGFSGIVVMASLMVWFPRLRPTLTWIHEIKDAKNEQ